MLYCPVFNPVHIQIKIMAADNRRMFANNIVESDAFLDLEHKDQVFYLHANMYADDDGFIDNIKMLQRQLGIKVDELVKRKFIIQFPNGICVIKHWRINNQLRKDRYHETKYIELKKTLFIRANGAYTLNPKNAIPVPAGHFTTSDIDEGDMGNQKPAIKVTKPFKKPKLEEVKAYCKENNSTVSAEKWYNHYESNGWYVGANPMQNWKASINTWSKNEFNKKGESKPANVLTAKSDDDKIAKITSRTIKD